MKDKQTILNGLQKRLTEVNNVVFLLRRKKTKYGLNGVDNFELRRMILLQTKLKKQIKGLTNKS